MGMVPQRMVFTSEVYEALLEDWPAVEALRRLIEAKQIELLTTEDQLAELEGLEGPAQELAVDLAATIDSPSVAWDGGLTYQGTTEQSGSEPVDLTAIQHEFGDIPAQVVATAMEEADVLVTGDSVLATRVRTDHDETVVVWDLETFRDFLQHPDQEPEESPS